MISNSRIKLVVISKLTSGSGRPAIMAGRDVANPAQRSYVVGWLDQASLAGFDRSNGQIRLGGLDCLVGLSRFDNLKIGYYICIVQNTLSDVPLQICSFLFMDHIMTVYEEILFASKERFTQCGCCIIHGYQG